MRRQTDRRGWKTRLVPGSAEGRRLGLILPQSKKTHMKYSNASSLALRMSYRSSAIKTRLVGSILYCSSAELSSNHGYTPAGGGETLSGTGPTMRDGQMMDSAFSRWMVRSRPEPVCKDSRDENEEAWAMPCGSLAGGETDSLDLRLWRCCAGMPRCSSADDEMGEESAGEDITVSSASEPDIIPASRDAAKLLEISGSDTMA